MGSVFGSGAARSGASFSLFGGSGDAGDGLSNWTRTPESGDRSPDRMTTRRVSSASELSIELGRLTLSPGLSVVGVGLADLTSGKNREGSDGFSATCTLRFRPMAGRTPRGSGHASARVGLGSTLSPSRFVQRITIFAGRLNVAGVRELSVDRRLTELLSTALHPYFQGFLRYAHDALPEVSDPFRSKIDGEKQQMERTPSSR